MSIAPIPRLQALVCSHVAVPHLLRRALIVAASAVTTLAVAPPEGAGAHGAVADPPSRPALSRMMLESVGRLFDATTPVRLGEEQGTPVIS